MSVAAFVLALLSIVLNIVVFWWLRSRHVRLTFESEPRDDVEGV